MLRPNRQWSVEVKEGSSQWSLWSRHDTKEEAIKERDKQRATGKFRAVRMVKPPWTA